MCETRLPPSYFHLFHVGYQLKERLSHMADSIFKNLHVVHTKRGFILFPRPVSPLCFPNLVTAPLYHQVKQAAKRNENGASRIPKHTSARPFCVGSIGGLPRFPVRSRRRSSEAEEHPTLPADPPGRLSEPVPGPDELEDMMIPDG